MFPMGALYRDSPFFVMREKLLDRIWHEMKQSSTNFFYAELLLDKQKSDCIIYKAVITLVVSGVTWYLSNEEYFGLGAGFVTYLLSDTKWLRPFFLKEPEEIEKIRGLCTDYRIYFNRLQNIFDKYSAGAISDNKAEVAYTEAFETNAANQTDISIAFGKINQKLNKKAALKSDEYLSKIYF